MHDSYAALPLAQITAGRLVNLYDLMDSAYDAPEIAQKSRDLGHVPIIDANPRRGGKAEADAEARARRLVGHPLAEDIRYNERSSAERVNGALKDNYGGRFVRVRGPAKVYCHLMFGVLALTVEQLTRLVTQFAGTRRKSGARRESGGLTAPKIMENRLREAQWPRRRRNMALDNPATPHPPDSVGSFARSSFACEFHKQRIAQYPFFR